MTPAEPAAEQQRRGSEHQAENHRDRRRRERQRDRQPGGHEHAVEDVTAEIVGACPVLQ